MEQLEIIPPVAAPQGPGVFVVHVRCVPIQGGLKGRPAPGTYVAVSSQQSLT